MGFGIKQADVAAIKAKTDTLPADPAGFTQVSSAITTAHATTNTLVATVDGVADAIKAKTDPLPASPANEATVTAVKAKTDALPTDPADESQVEGAISTTQTAMTDEVKKGVSPVDFWSVPIDVINLPASPTDTNLPDVVVSGLPTGISLIRVVAMLKVRAIENTSAAGTNGINGTQYIRVKPNAGQWGVADIAAIQLLDNQWLLALSTRESGDLLIGSYDLKATVNGNGTYNFRFEDALVDLANLRLNDVLVGLRFFFTTS